MNSHLLVAAIALLLMGQVHANGLVAPLKFDKSQYFANESVQLTVQGKGLCKNIEINWGDGQKDVIAQWDFGAIVGQKNLQATHKYLEAKSYFPGVKTIPGPTLAEQCGSHSGSVNVVWPGKLAKVMAAPSPVETGKSVEIVIEGAGVCPASANIRVTPPSGGAAQVLGAVFAPDAPWPRKASFVPTEVGTWIIGHSLAPGQSVAASAGCFSMPAGSDGKFVVVAKPAPAVVPAAGGGVSAPAGVVNANVGRPSGVVGGTLPNVTLVAPSGGTPAPCSTPTINSLSGNLVTSKPIGIAGCGFGAAVGDVLVKGTFNNQPNQTVKLLVDAWSDTAIQAKLPADISGAPDHAVALQVVMPGGAKSVDKSVNFVAKREKIVLGLNDLTEYETGNGGIYEWHRASKLEPYQGGLCGTTICYDRKLMPTPPFVNAGMDHFRISLKNGWGKSSLKLVQTDSGADFNTFGTTTGPKPTLLDQSSGTEFKAAVKWGVLGPLGWIRYRLEMEIEGPRGVPFR
jgi:hypothetical protein